MGLLPTVYFNHFLMLSEAIHILLLNEITPELLDRAHGLLLNFYSNVKKHYMEANLNILTSPACSFGRGCYTIRSIMDMHTPVSILKMQISSC